MENNNSYQNIDTPLKNPLEIPKKEPFKFDLKDPKIKILFILGIIIVILVILSILTIVLRKPPQKIVQPTPTPTTSIKPTVVESIVPAEFVDKFNQIENDLKRDESFQPPQIDTEIGLQ